MYHRLISDGKHQQQHQQHDAHDAHPPKHAEYYSQWHNLSTILIQSLWRGHCIRQKYSHAYHRHFCAVKIQSVVRGRQLRLRLQYANHHRTNSNNAPPSVRYHRRVLSSAIRIQRFWRMSLLLVSSSSSSSSHDDELTATKALMSNNQSKKKNQLYQTSLNDDAAAARTIQKRWNIYKNRKGLISMRRRAMHYWELDMSKLHHHPQHQQQQQQEMQLRSHAAISIQSRWRAYSQRKQFEFLRSNAIRIQTTFRSMHGSRQCNRRREKACVIQSFVRMSWTMRSLRGNVAIATSTPTPTKTIPIQTNSSSARENETTQDDHRSSPDNEPFTPNNNNNNTSVARMIRILNAVSSTPVFPLRELGGSPSKNNTMRRGEGIVPDARAGEKRRDDRYELSKSVLRNTAALTVGAGRKESKESKKGRKNKSRLGSKRRTSKTKRKEKVEEKIMRDLSMECIDLMTRMKRVPKYSPEWVLCKLEMKLVSEELQHLYAESIGKRARV